MPPRSEELARTQAKAMVSALRSELVEAVSLRTSPLQSDKMLLEFSMQTREIWVVADGARRSLLNERKGLTEEVAELRTQLSRGSATLEVDARRLESDVSRLVLVQHLRSPSQRTN